MWLPATALAHTRSKFRSGLATQRVAFKKLAKRLTAMRFLTRLTNRPPLLVCLLLTTGVRTRAAAPGNSLHEQIDAALAASPVAAAAPMASDAEYLRRAHLTLVGCIPSAEETRSFLANSNPDKRAALVDSLLASPGWVRHMVDTFDVMLMERRPAKNADAASWRQWLWSCFANGQSWDQTVREILSADGVEPKTKPASRWLLDREAEPNLLTRDTSRIFLGRDLACAQCHNHPRIDDYMQRDYQGIFAFFSRTSLHQPDTKVPAVLTESAAGEVSFKDVLSSVPGSTLPKVPGRGELADPAAPPDGVWAVAPNDKDKNVRPVPKYSRRLRLADELIASRDFSRNIVNRLWAMVMGRGLVEPLDFAHSENAPAHPALLDHLADALAAMKFDLKAFQRELVLTEAFQRAFDLPEVKPVANAADLEAEAKRKEATASDMEATLLRIQDDWEAAQIKVASLEKEWSTAVAAIAPLKKALDEATAAKMPPADLQARQAAMDAAQKSAAAAKAKLTEATTEAAKLATETSSAARQKQDAAIAAKFASRLAKEAAAFCACANNQTAIEAARRELAAAETRCAEAKVLQTKAESDFARSQSLLPSQQKDQLTQNAALQNALNAKIESRLALMVEAEASTTPQQAEAAARKLAEAEITVKSTQTAYQNASAQVQRTAEQLTAAKSALTAATQACTAAGNQATMAKASMSEAEAAHLRSRETLTASSSEAFAIGRQNPLTPEQLCWSYLQATGQLQANRVAAEAELAKSQPLTDTDKADPAKLAARAFAVEAELRKKMQGNIDVFVRLFGGAAGQPQTEFFATADQALYFKNAGIPRGWFTGDFNQQITKADASAVADVLFSALLSRLPTEEEKLDVTAFLAARPPQEKLPAAQDMAWAMLTSAEFRFNH